VDKDEKFRTREALISQYGRLSKEARIRICARTLIVLISHPECFQRGDNNTYITDGT